MKTEKLYLLFLGGVLLLAGCGSSDTETSQAEPSNESTATEVSAEETVEATLPDGNATILMLGDSITAGYGIDPEQAFPALIQQRIDSLDLPYTVINAGLSGETSAGGLRRIDWLLRQPVDIMLLELGGNDGLRGTSVEVTKQNLQAIIDKAKEGNADMQILLAGMQVPTNLGQDYTRQFREVYPELAEANDLPLIPFILEGVGGVPELNLPDQIHPTAEGHKIVAETVWDGLEPLLKIES